MATQQVAKLPNLPPVSDREIRARILGKFGTAALKIYDQLRNILGLPIENAAYGAIYQEEIPSDMSGIPSDRKKTLADLLGINVQDQSGVLDSSGVLVPGQAAIQSTSGIFDFLDNKSVVYIIAGLLILFAFTQLK